MLSTNCLLGGRLAAGLRVASADFVFVAGFFAGAFFAVGFFVAVFFGGFVCFADGFFFVGMIISPLAVYGCYPADSVYLQATYCHSIPKNCS
jgi:hypothetical protein